MGMQVKRLRSVMHSTLQGLSITAKTQSIVATDLGPITLEHAAAGTYGYFSEAHGCQVGSRSSSDACLLHCDRTLHAARTLCVWSQLRGAPVSARRVCRLWVTALGPQRGGSMLRMQLAADG